MYDKRQAVSPDDRFRGIVGDGLLPKDFILSSLIAIDETIRARSFFNHFSLLPVF